jgi:membrane protein required for colicin V production
VNALDFGLLATVAIFAAIGTLRGLVRSTFFLVNWVLAGTIAWLLAAPTASVFKHTIEDPLTRTLIAFVLLFAFAFVVGIFASSTLHKMIESIPVLKTSNRLLGGVVGSAIGIVVVVLAFMLAGLTSLPHNGWWRHSLLAPYFESLAAFASDFLPADIARYIRYG